LARRKPVRQRAVHKFRKIPGLTKKGYRQSYHHETWRLGASHGNKYDLK
jgi:hypothetical protein